jgi:CRISP-associated protein Cas1
MKQPIYIFSDGHLQRRQNTLSFVDKDGKKKYVPVENTSELYVFGELDLNKRLLEFLTRNEILIHFFNHYGYYIGSFYPREHYNSGCLILSQAAHYLDIGKRMDIARRFIVGASANMIRVISYYNRRGVDLDSVIEKLNSESSNLDRQKSPETLMAVEGNIREVYYGAFDAILKSDEFSFAKRTRRPPRNRLNALISFGNSMMYVLALSEIYRTHLDPRIGFLHTTNFRRFSLNLDVAEVFKPTFVDRLIFAVVNKGQIQDKHFSKQAGGIYLTDAGRKIFVEEWEKKLHTTIDHPKLNRKVSYRRLVRLDLYKIEKHLLEDQPYEPYLAGW